MMRSVLAVVAGYAAWTVLWLMGNNYLFSEATRVVGEGELYSAKGPLLGILLLSVVCSLLAGFITAKIAKAPTSKPVLVMAILLLLTGIGVQASVWALMPVWYHILFLMLLVPVAMVGGRFGAASVT